VYILAIFPPLEGGGTKRGTFWSLGKKIGPSQKKKIRIKKFKIFIENLLLINTLSSNFIIREAQFSFGKDSAQTTKALLNHTLGRKSPHSNILYFLVWGSKLLMSKHNYLFGEAFFLPQKRSTKHNWGSSNLTLGKPIFLDEGIYFAYLKKQYPEF